MRLVYMSAKRKERPSSISQTANKAKSSIKIVIVKMICLNSRPFKNANEIKSFNDLRLLFVVKKQTKTMFFNYL